MVAVSHERMMLSSSAGVAWEIERSSRVLAGSESKDVRMGMSDGRRERRVRGRVVDVRVVEGIDVSRRLLFELFWI